MSCGEMHGFETREAWAHFFEEYNQSVVRLNEQGYALLTSDLELDEWVRKYKENSRAIREAYIQNELLLDQHIRYYTNEPSRWTREVADPLLAHLFRHITRMEDMSCAFMAAESLQQFYRSLGDEIALMKCCTVKALCYTLLDSIHLAANSLRECEQGIAFYERNFSSMTPEEQSMGLSLYDVECNLLTLKLNLRFGQPKELLSKLLDCCHRAEAATAYVLKTDKGYDFNRNLPPFNAYIASAAAVASPEDCTPEQAAEIHQRAQTYVDSVRADGSEDIFVSQITLLMAARLTGTDTTEEMRQLVHDFIGRFSGAYASEDGWYARDLDDIIGCLREAVCILYTDDYQAEDCQRVLQIILNFYSALPLGTYINYVVGVNTYPFICKSLRYLGKDADPMLSLLQLTVFRQPQTAMHSIMVGRLATEILASLIQWRPELLTGPGLAPTPEIVRTHASDFLDFIYAGTLLHDIGKILCSNVINTQYRRLADVEFDTLRFHPVTGGEMLLSIPQLSMFYDIAVGHHKTFDGAYGYPKGFDNQSSAQKIFIDIITICDSLDAATDKLGRNYAQVKTFDMVLEELRGGKGTRYSGPLVDLIDEDKELLEKLRFLLDEGRGETYYAVHQMIQNRTGILPRRTSVNEWR